MAFWINRQRRLDFPSMDSSSRGYIGSTSEKTSKYQNDGNSAERKKSECTNENQSLTQSRTLKTIRDDSLASSRDGKISQLAGRFKMFNIHNQVVTMRRKGKTIG